MELPRRTRGDELLRSGELLGLRRRLRDIARQPHLASEAKALRNGREELQSDFERIILRLEYVSPDDAAGFGKICAELERYLEDLKTHGQKEMEFLQRSFNQEEGESG